MLSNEIIICLEELALEEFNDLVLNALIKAQVSTSICMESNHTGEAIGVLSN